VPFFCPQIYCRARHPWRGDVYKKNEIWQYIIYMKKIMCLILIQMCILYSCKRNERNTVMLPDIKNWQYYAETLSKDEETIADIKKEDAEPIIVENDDIYSKTNELWNKIYSYDDDVNVYRELETQLFDFIITYLKTTESLNIDNIKKMPFINTTISTDGKIKIYDFLINYSDYTYYSFIQYANDSGDLIVLCVDKTVLHLFARMKYTDIYNLDENKYVFCAYTQWGNTRSVRFVTMELKNNILVPYMAFNNDHTFRYVSAPSEGVWRIDLAADISKNNPYKIKIVYDVHEDKKNYFKWKKTKADSGIIFTMYEVYDILEFNYNGSEYVGDYDKFIEISQPSTEG
jgi:hypothetical protein